VNIKNGKIINNIFQFRNGDILQICEDNRWTDLGVINDSKSLAVDMARNNFTVLGKPGRVVRR